MVISDNFVWAHMPKAAGDATHKMMAAVPGLVRWEASLESNEKHDGYWVHAEEIAGKLRVMNIRRLPSWILSTANHKAMNGLFPDYRPMPMPSVEEMVEEQAPDETLRWMTGPDLPVQRWLRAENIADDAEALMREFGFDRTRIREAVTSVPWVGNTYDHDVDRVFTPMQVARMYELNPTWAASEEAAYGSVP